MGKTEKTKQTEQGEELSSPKVVVQRILALLEAAKAKMEKSVERGQLKMALNALIKGTGHPAFKQQMLLNLEKQILSDPSAKNMGDFDMVGMIPLCKLAKLAYKKETEVLHEELKEMGYELEHHNTVVNAGNVGFYAALNHKEKVLLIGIKGTSSMGDAITNCVAATMPHTCTPNCPYSGSPEKEREVRCHEGMLIAATKLFVEIEPIMMKTAALQEGYTVKVVGHSLGAGTAAILGVLLRSKGNDMIREPGFLHVWAFACPPVLDIESAMESKQFITSVVSKSDIVPRASVANLAIVTKLLNELALKMQEMNGGKAVAGLKGHLMLKKKMKEMEDSEEPPLPLDMLAEFVEKSQSAVVLADRDHLYVPGEIVMFYQKLDSPIVEVAEDNEEDHVQTCACIIDGSHKALRMIDFNSECIADHGCGEYIVAIEICSGANSSSSSQEEYC